MSKVIALPLLSFVVVLLVAGCADAWAECQQPTGALVKQPRAVGAFTAVRSEGSIDVRVSQGATRAVTVEAPVDLQDRIRTTLEGGTLVIDTVGGCWRSNQPVRVDITAPRFDRLSMSGSGELRTGNTLRSPRLAVELSGSGDAVVAVEGSELSVNIAGSGDASVSGTAADVRVAIAGSGDVDVSSLPAERATVSIAGSGDAKVRASRSLSADIAGSGNVIYHGQPAVRRSVVGSGDVRPAR